MEKILAYGKHYKYEIVGVIVISIVYVLIKIFVKEKEKKEEKETKEIKTEVMLKDDNKKEFKELLMEMRKISKGLNEMVRYNKSINPKDNYFNFRNEYITKDIEKVKLLIDTKSMEKHNSDEHLNTSQYKVLFGVDKNNDAEGNTIYFGEKLSNVIGFRLTRATIPDTLYNITSTNNTFIFNYDDQSYTGTLVEGAYTFRSLANEFQRALNVGYTEGGGGEGNIFIVTSDSGSFKYSIDLDDSLSEDDPTELPRLEFRWGQLNNGVHKLVGGIMDGISGTEVIDPSQGHEYPYTFKNTVDHSIHFVDLVIPEIPSAASKISANGYNIIDRIPLTGIRGNLFTYIPLEEGTPWTQNYFYPININQLSISLYDDTTSNLLKNNNNDHMLEFELALLKNTKLLK